eukprot:3625450-Rhodomonas_salina.1
MNSITPVSHCLLPRPQQRQLTASVMSPHSDTKDTISACTRGHDVGIVVRGLSYGLDIPALGSMGNGWSNRVVRVERKGAGAVLCWREVLLCSSGGDGHAFGHEEQQHWPTHAQDQRSAHRHAIDIQQPNIHNRSQQASRKASAQPILCCFA